MATADGPAPGASALAAPGELVEVSRGAHGDCGTDGIRGRVDRRDLAVGVVRHVDGRGYAAGGDRRRNGGQGERRGTHAQHAQDTCQTFPAPSMAHLQLLSGGVSNWLAA